MRRSVLSRSVIGAAAFAVVSATLSVSPASAAPVPDTIAMINAKAQDVCRRSPASPANLVPKDIRYASAPLGAGTEATVATVDVVNDPAYGYESCTFAFFTAPYSSAVIGHYRLQVQEGGIVDADATRRVPFSGDRHIGQTYTVFGEPVFTEGQFGVQASLSVDGKVLTQSSQRTLIVTPTPKTAQQKKIAKKKYEQRKAKAKKTFKKAIKKASGNTKKRRIARYYLHNQLKGAKQKYLKGIATSRTRMVEKQVRTETPINSTVRLDLPDGL
ncbi:hypothetical protein [Aeromicrobium fastidiosum]|uniref:hypothetical protein n=1 Tax=Aeromicrobium fastidiosum TaxID=52699 RepID=UPI00165EEB82|nr:hypothetical protein [Aeromicrobium fastidiosum]MBP2390008.1 hypothetical protein [Aeromicrobium fastidiosum]